MPASLRNIVVRRDRWCSPPGFEICVEFPEKPCEREVLSIFKLFFSDARSRITPFPALGSILRHCIALNKASHRDVIYIEVGCLLNLYANVAVSKRYQSMLRAGRCLGDDAVVVDSKIQSGMCVSKAE